MIQVLLDLYNKLLRGNKTDAQWQLKPIYIYHTFILHYLSQIHFLQSDQSFLPWLLAERVTAFEKWAQETALTILHIWTIRLRQIPSYFKTCPVYAQQTMLYKCRMCFQPLNSACVPGWCLGFHFYKTRSYSLRLWRLAGHFSAICTKITDTKKEGS